MQTVTITVQTNYFREGNVVGGFEEVSEPLSPAQARQLLLSVGIVRHRFSRASKITSFREGNTQRIIHINPAQA